MGAPCHKGPFLHITPAGLKFPLSFRQKNTFFYFSGNPEGPLALQFSRIWATDCDLPHIKRNLPPPPHSARGTKDNPNSFSTWGRWRTPQVVLFLSKIGFLNIWQKCHSSLPVLICGSGWTSDMSTDIYFNKKKTFVETFQTPAGGLSSKSRGRLRLKW